MRRACATWKALAEAVISSTGMPIPAQYVCRRRCRYRADNKPCVPVHCLSFGARQVNGGAVAQNLEKIGTKALYVKADLTSVADTENVHHMDMCIGMRIDMCMDICMDMHMDMHMDICMEVCMDMCTDMCMDMCTDMCADLRADVWIDSHALPAIGEGSSRPRRRRFERPARPCNRHARR